MSIKLPLSIDDTTEQDKRNNFGKLQAPDRIQRTHKPFALFRSEGPASSSLDSSSFCCLLTALNNCTTIGVPVYAKEQERKGG